VAGAGVSCTSNVPAARATAPTRSPTSPAPRSRWASRARPRRACRSPTNRPRSTSGSAATAAHRRPAWIRRWPNCCS